MTRYSLDLVGEDKDVFLEMFERSSHKHKTKFLRQVIRERAETELGGEFTDESEQEDRGDNRINYDPTELSERYTLTLDELNRVLDEYDNPAIDPAHIGKVPKRVERKGEVVAACYRYEFDPNTEVEKDSIVDCVKESIGAGSTNEVLQNRVGAAARAFYSREKEGAEGILPADNVQPLLSEFYWRESEARPSEPTLEGMLDLFEDCIEKADMIDTEMLQWRMSNIEVLLEVAEEYGDDEVVEQAEEYRSELSEYVE